MIPAISFLRTHTFRKILQGPRSKGNHYSPSELGQPLANYSINAQDAEEIRIPVAHGHIAGRNFMITTSTWLFTSLHYSGKRWGNLSGYPIFCLHGLCDNANSFLPIGPLLSSKHQYIALDATGHGFSSHLPLGVALNVWELVISVRRAMEYFQFKRFSILGHRYVTHIKKK